MSAHRKHERQLRQQALKTALPAPERAINSNDAEEKLARVVAENHDASLQETDSPEAVTTCEAEEQPEALRAQEERDFAAELEEEKRARQHERQEKDALKKKLQEAEQEMSKQTKSLEREKRENERQRLHYEGRIKELEQRAGETHAPRAASAAAAEDFPANKATFRIDLYPHQGRFQGKIEHILSHEKRAFTGVDPLALAEFINAHLPSLENKTEELQKLVTLQNEEERGAPIPTLVSREAATSQLAARLRAMEIVLAGTSKRTSLLRDNQAFDVELELDLDDKSAAAEQTLQCSVGLFVKRIEGGPRQNLGAVTHQLARASASPVRVPGLQLQRGTYRLEALVNMQVSSAQAQALTAHKLIHVY